jgi:hypothetical protein
LRVQHVGQIGLGFFGPPRDLGVAFANGLGERSRAVYHASPSKGGRGREAGAPAACIDDACVLDPESSSPESGVEHYCRKLQRRLREFHGFHRQKSLNRFGASAV